MLVEVAGAVFEVERGAGFVVGELFEEDGGFVVFVEDAGGDVAGEPGIEASEGVCNSFANSGCTFGAGSGEGFDSFPETSRIFIGDREDSYTALRASGFADEMCAAAMVGVGHGSVYDLDERYQVSNVLFAIL